MTAEQVFGQRILQVRKSRGWSQTKLADWMRAEGVSLTRLSVAGIEAGERRIRLNEAVAAAGALGLPLADLLKPVDCAACSDVPPPGFTCQTCGKPTTTNDPEDKS